LWRLLKDRQAPQWAAAPGDDGSGSVATPNGNAPGLEAAIPEQRTPDASASAGDHTAGIELALGQASEVGTEPAPEERNAPIAADNAAVATATLSLEQQAMIQLALQSGGTLRFASDGAIEVLPASATTTPVPTPMESTTPTVLHESRPAPAGSGGARQEILGAARALTARTGQTTFTATEIAAELRHTGSRYAEGTVKTMVASHLVGEGHLERVGRGLYRIASRGHRDLTTLGDA
jgi:hypothetical protein